MHKLIIGLAMVAALPVCAQTANPDRSATSSSSSETAAYGNNITFNSSAPEVQRIETVNRSDGTQRIEQSGETHQYVEYGGTHRIKSAAQAYAPPVGVTSPCVIGSSVGIAGMGWGFSGGSGHKDDGCERRAAAALMHSFGHAEAAREVLCVDPTVAAAYARAGMPCRAVLLSQAEVPVSSRTGQSVTTPVCYADKKVAKRAGMPVCLKTGPSYIDPSAAP
jgi:hypothetical protein